MNPLISRKQLLVAESELNRAQLVQEWQSMAAEVHTLTHKAKAVGSFVSAATLVASLAFFRRKTSAPGAAEKPTWWRTALQGAQVASSLWATFRPRWRGQKDK